MRYEVSIDLDGDDRSEELETAIHWALYDMTKAHERPAEFKVRLQAVQEPDTRALRTGMQL